MTVAARLSRVIIDWLASLDPAQRATARFPFESKERFVWAFTPGDREGLALRDMSPDQRSWAMRVVEASMSDRGAREVSAIMALETVLGEIERDAGRAN